MGNESKEIPAKAHPEIRTTAANDEIYLQVMLQQESEKVDENGVMIKDGQDEKDINGDGDDTSRNEGDICDSPFSMSKLKLSGTSKKSKNCLYTVYNPHQNTKNFIQHEFQHCDFVYKMDKHIRGNAIIINMKNFSSQTGLSDFPRHGTEKDKEKLVELLLELAFSVHCYTDVTKTEINDALREASKNKEKLDCVACFILSHGQDGLIYAYDGPMEIKGLAHLFEVPAWLGKPKLFFIQACQGDEFMDGIFPLDEVDGRGSNKTISLPSQADFLFAYSTAPGFYSWRNTKNGSWFIQTLVDIFRKYAHSLDVVQMLTRVNLKMSCQRSNTDDEETDNKRQVACIVSRLRKEFFFFPPSGQLKELS